jgi:hypothetical protein
MDIEPEVEYSEDDFEAPILEEDEDEEGEGDLSQLVSDPVAPELDSYATFSHLGTDMHLARTETLLHLT